MHKGLTEQIVLQYSNWVFYSFFKFEIEKYFRGRDILSEAFNLFILASRTFYLASKKDGRFEARIRARGPYAGHQSC